MPRGKRRELGYMKKYDYMSNADALAAIALRDLETAFEKEIARIHRKAKG